MDSDPTFTYPNDDLYIPNRNKTKTVAYFNLQEKYIPDTVPSLIYRLVFIDCFDRNSALKKERKMLQQKAYFVVEMLTF